MIRNTVLEARNQQDYFEYLLKARPVVDEDVRAALLNWAVTVPPLTRIKPDSSSIREMVRQITATVVIDILSALFNKGLESDCVQRMEEYLDLIELPFVSSQISNLLEDTEEGARQGKTSQVRRSVI